MLERWRKRSKRTSGTRDQGFYSPPSAVRSASAAELPVRAFFRCGFGISAGMILQRGTVCSFDAKLAGVSQADMAYRLQCVPRFERSRGQERHAACGAPCGRALPWRGGGHAASAAAWRAGSIDLMEHRNAVRRGCYHGWPANGAGRTHGRLRRHQAERASRRPGRAFGKTAAGCRKSAGLSVRVGRWTVREGRCT